MGWSWWSLGNRPAWFPVLAAVFGVVFGPSLEWSPWAWFFIGLIGVAVALALRRVGPIFAGLLAAFAFGAGLAELTLDVAMPPLGPRVRVQGTVERAGPHSLTLAVSHLDEEPTRFRAALSGDAAGLLEGETLVLEAKFRPLAEAGNPGEWSRAEWAWRRGQPVSGSFARARVVRIAAAPEWRAWLEREQQALARDTRAQSDEELAASLLLTLSAGQRASLDDETEETFARSGLAHVLSVSGLHVAVLAFTLFRALRWALSRRQQRLTRRVEPRAWAGPLAVPLVWAYVTFTGWQAPAVRSAVMCTLVLLAWSTRRRSDALNALALAGLGMVAIDPAAPFELSVQLSFLAVLGLVLLSPAVRAWVPLAPPSPADHEGWSLRWRRWREEALQTVCTSVAVTVTTAPLVLVAFQRVSVAGVVSNVVAMPLSGVLTLVAAGGAAVHVVSPLLASPLLWLGVWLSKLLLGLAALFAAAPWAAVPLPAPSVWVMAAWWAGWAAVALAPGRWRWLGMLAPIALALHVSAPNASRDELRVTFLSVGHGDAVVLSSRGQAALIDGGGVPDGQDTGRRFVLPYLRSQRVDRLALTALSHAHPDHALGLISTLEVVPTSRLWLPAGVGEGTLVRELLAASEGAEVEEKEAGEPGMTLGAATLEVLGPPRDRAALLGENDRSLVILARHGEVSFLLTGDLEAAGEAALEVGAVTVLKASHHGSDTSSTPAFVERTKPRHVVFCVGRRNRFHFPREDVVTRWLEAGARCYRTDLDGAITFVSDGHDVKVERFAPRGERDARRGLVPLRRR